VKRALVLPLLVLLVQDSRPAHGVDWLARARELGRRFPGVSFDRARSVLCAPSREARAVLASYVPGAARDAVTDPATSRGAIRLNRAGSVCLIRWAEHDDGLEVGTPAPAAWNPGTGDETIWHHPHTRLGERTIDEIAVAMRERGIRVTPGGVSTMNVSASRRWSLEGAGRLRGLDVVQTVVAQEAMGFGAFRWHKMGFHTPRTILYEYDFGPDDSDAGTEEIWIWAQRDGGGWHVSAVSDDGDSRAEEAFLLDALGQG
jgi:hypothetical protein